MIMLSDNVSGSPLGALSWRAATLAVDMPQDRSFLLTPLEPVDPGHEQPEDCHRDLRSPGISPTPQKSLFEMDSEDLRAAERAWLQTVGSFKLNSMHALRASKASGDDLSSQKTSDPCLAAEDQTRIPSDFQKPSSRTPSNEQLPDSVTDQGTIKACRGLTDKFSMASEGEHLLAEEESASQSRHGSMSLRQRFSTFMAARRSGSGTYASVPSSELDPAQGLGAAISDAGLDAAAPRTAMASPATEQPASASLPVNRHVADGRTTPDTPAGATAAASAVSPCQPNPALVSADAPEEHADLSQPHALAAAVDALEKLDKPLESTHMQRRPFTKLISIRRPSAALRRPSQYLEVPAEMLQTPTDSCSAQPAAPSSEGPNSMKTASGQIQGGPDPPFDSSASARQVGGPQHPTNPQSTHDASTPRQSSAQLVQAAELESRDSAIALADLQEAMLAEHKTSAGIQANLAGETLSGPCIAESGQYEVPAEPHNAAAESLKSLASSTVSGTRDLHAALRNSPSDACSLESACPSFVGRLAHPAWHEQRTAASTGATSMQQVKKKPMLRGRTAEECGIRMYERARAAQHLRQTR